MNRQVGIMVIQHESNTFLNDKTAIEQFAGDTFTGAAILDVHGAAHHEIGGFLQGLSEARIEAVPILVARAVPGGVVTTEAYDWLTDAAWRGLLQAMPLDGLLVAPHGAGVSEKHMDMDGAWLSALRETVGPDVPVFCTLDLHANISPAMVEACDAMIVYRTNPHLDQRERGLEAARLMAGTLQGKVRPVQAASFPPVAIDIERQLTSAGPSQEIFAEADRMLGDTRVLSNSIALGFPYADVPEMGAAAIAVTNDDPVLARQQADDLGRYIWNRRFDLRGTYTSVSEAMSAARNAQPPVCLLDMGDNVGGGSPGDGTFLLHALEHADLNPSLVCIRDAVTVRRAIEARVGDELSVSLGGHSDDRHGVPLQTRVTVIGVHAGKFEDLEPHHGGQRYFDMGPTVTVETPGGVTVLLTTERVAPFSLGMITSCGLDPRRFRVVVAKGVHAPLAAYRPVCRTFIRVDTPGVTTADMTRLEFVHRRRPLFPFETSFSG